MNKQRMEEIKKEFMETVWNPSDSYHWEGSVDTILDFIENLLTKSDEEAVEELVDGAGTVWVKKAQRQAECEKYLDEFIELLHLQATSEKSIYEATTRDMKITVMDLYRHAGQFKKEQREHE